MRSPHLQVVSQNHSAAPRLSQPARLGQILVEAGEITQGQLVRALGIQLRLNARLGEILVSEGWLREEVILDALARQFDTIQVDLSAEPPDPDLCRLMPADFWLRHRALAWARHNGVLLIATADPARFAAVKDGLSRLGEKVRPVIASETGIQKATADAFNDQLIARASARVEPRLSCRTWSGMSRAAMFATLAAAAAVLLSAPAAVFGGLLLLAFGTLALFCSLRIMGGLARMAAGLTAPGADACVRLPRVSVMVPLFHEQEIAGALLKRLQRLTYPKALLDVVLVLEEKDDITREALARTKLPHWIRVIEVPEDGPLTTKPRAMNYALDFCKGEIIGIWDAEDAPEPSQIEKVVDRFANAPPEVVCLQGILDFYNPRSNWRARCFTIEYASWFRVLLSGIARLRLVVPLGGTTLYFRRDILEQLGGWDAHNVTEDADLGVRLCRAGYRTEIIDTTTFEEANHRAWPWVRQRSRWLKGFMVTYLVHMRNPLGLFRDLGAWRFFGFQAFFLGTLGQFLLAPILWSFWPVAFGLPHPAADILPGGLLEPMFTLMIAAEVVNLCVGISAVWARERRFLLPWVPAMVLYYPLGALAAYKALFELCWIPFYWDKTQHGQAEADLPGH
ncbi:glycosyltransferase [Jhaorihella thermophila]|uniref:Type II secretion system protein GspE N-terminal domain-containing protein n=1 Tax=Jhaorihella thermophila TaxID=488547 RepID=A0A1H5TXU5_9RHOB|nr:glycosyltransferase [Jhaorihella thermophila]SEF67589.1 hypothetical protein SAMN05421751_10386 [Jhaorihella thermophila]